MEDAGDEDGVVFVQADEEIGPGKKAQPDKALTGFYGTYHDLIIYGAIVNIIIMTRHTIEHTPRLSSPRRTGIYTGVFPWV